MQLYKGNQFSFQLLFAKVMLVLVLFVLGTCFVLGFHSCDERMESVSEKFFFLVFRWQTFQGRSCLTAHFFRTTGPDYAKDF